MCNNLGKIDRTVRILAGIILLYMALMQLYTPYTWIGIVPLLTGALGFCPVYKLLGINRKLAKNK